MTHIALATCEKKPSLTEDDELLSKAVREMGWHVSVHPWSAEVDWLRYDVVLIRSAWDYHLRAGEFAAWIKSLQSAGVLLLNPADLLLWNINKSYLIRLQKKGVKIPPTVVVAASSQVALADILSSNNWQKAVVKPAVSATAHETWITTSSHTQLDQERFEAQLRSGDVLVQKFLEEIPASGEISLIYFNGVFSHAVLKRAKAGDFRVQSDFGGSSEKFEPSPVVIADGRRILDAAPQLPVYARVDGAMVDGAFTLMELELIEPFLFFTTAPNSVHLFASALADAVASGKQPTGTTHRLVHSTSGSGSTSQ